MLRFCSKERRKPRAGSQAQFPKPGFLQKPTFAMFPFVVVTEDGARAQGTLAHMVSRRRRDPSFHMQRRQQRRARANKVSWVDIPTHLFHLPTIRTPFDSGKPWPSKLRGKYVAPTEREVLLQSPMLARAAIKGGASHLTATRLDLIGGLTELATDVTPTTPAVIQRSTCLFCVHQNFPNLAKSD